MNGKEKETKKAYQIAKKSKWQRTFHKCVDRLNRRNFVNHNR